MNIISTKKILILLIVVISIMILGKVNQSFATVTITSEDITITSEDIICTEKDILLYNLSNNATFEVVTKIPEGSNIVIRSKHGDGIEERTYFIWVISIINDDQFKIDYTGYIFQKDIDGEYIIESKTLSFDTRGGTEVSNIKFKYGDTITLPTTTKEGYNFLGWATTEEAEEKEYDPGQAVCIYASWDITYYAIWDEKEIVIEEEPEVILEPIITTVKETINKKGNIEKNIELKNANGEVIATIYKNQEVTVIEETQDGHYKIKWEKTGVYAHKSYLNNNKTKGIGPNIRTAPNGNGEKIGDIKAGQTITRGGQTGDYIKINFEITGYVNKEDVTVKETSATTLFSNGGLFQNLFNGGIMQVFSKLISGEGTGGLLGTLSGIIREKTESNSIITNGLKFLGKGMDFIGNKIFGENNQRGSITQNLGTGVILLYTLPKVFSSL